MLRYPSRTLSRAAMVRGGATAVAHPAMCAAQRCFTDKALIGACSSFLTCSTTLGLFHLIVTPVSSTIAAATVATATASGAMCVIDGGSTSGTAFGVFIGIMCAAAGGYHTKSQKEPWRK